MVNLDATKVSYFELRINFLLINLEIHYTKRSRNKR